MKNAFLILQFIIINFFLGAQTCTDFPNISKSIVDNTKICPEALVNDLVQLNESIQDIHPNPFLYIADSVYYQSYKKALFAASSEKTVLEFAQIVADFVHSLKDSHTNFNPRDLLFQSSRKKAVVPYNSEKDPTKKESLKQILIKLTKQIQGYEKNLIQLRDKEEEYIQQMNADAQLDVSAID